MRINSVSSNYYNNVYFTQPNFKGFLGGADITKVDGMNIVSSKRPPVDIFIDSKMSYRLGNSLLKKSASIYDKIIPFAEFDAISMQPREGLALDGTYSYNEEDGTYVVVDKVGEKAKTICYGYEADEANDIEFANSLINFDDNGRISNIIFGFAKSGSICFVKQHFDFSYDDDGNLKQMVAFISDKLSPIDNVDEMYAYKDGKVVEICKNLAYYDDNKACAEFEFQYDNGNLYGCAKNCNVTFHDDESIKKSGVANKVYIYKNGKLTQFWDVNSRDIDASLHSYKLNIYG